MRATLCATLVLFLSVGLIWADDKQSDGKGQPSPEEMMKAMAEAGKPGPEHAKLQPLVGSWTYTCKTWMDPSKPPVEGKGTIERNWILGGRFLEERVEGTGVDGHSSFEGFGLIGYDKAHKKYTSVWACNMNTSTATGEGAIDASGKQLTFKTKMYCPVMKKMVEGRDELRIEGNDKIVMESYMIDGDNEMKIMELISVRKK